MTKRRHRAPRVTFVPRIVSEPPPSADLRQGLAALIRAFAARVQQGTVQSEHSTTGDEPDTDKPTARPADGDLSLRRREGVDRREFDEDTFAK